MKRIIILSACVLLTARAFAQQEPAPKGPPVKVDVLNVCNPNDDEQRQIKTALAQIPRNPRYSGDFEISRGHSTLEDTASDWVRLRREFSGGPFTATHFLYSREGAAARETVVFFSREVKNVVQIALEDKVSVAGSAANMLSTNTPVSRISLERLGKPHLVLARCPAGDQSKYEPLFATASEIMASYRASSGAREVVPAELGRLSLGAGPGYRPPKVKPMVKR